MRSLSPTGRARLLASVAVVTLFVGCGLSTSGTGTAAAPCTTLAHCNDGNLCTNDRCTESGACESDPAPNGEPLEQIAGDCKQVTCADGVESSAPDDADADDGDPCTKDACNAGVAAHTTLPDGDPCKLGASDGKCIAGECVIACNGGDQCDDGKPCTSDTCDLAAKKCVFAAAYDGIVPPGVEDLDDDCVDEVCLGGVLSTVVDDADLPDDSNECTADTCNEGSPNNETLTGSTCQGTKHCDGDAQCVDCLMASHCGSAPCIDYACDEGACSSSNKPPVSMGDGTGNGDCLASACDGMGNLVEVTDATDVPPSDGNDCTKDECALQGPVHTPQTGASCNDGGGSICNGATCVECLTNADCVAPQTCGVGGANECGCIPQSMGATCSGKCNTVVNNCGQNVNCGGCPAGKSCGGGGTPNVCGCNPSSCCNGSEDGNETDVDCGGGSCPKCGIGKGCNSDDDCTSNQCNTGQGECM